MTYTFEDVLDEIGGMGRFQLLLTLVVHGSQMPMAMGMMLMTFGGKIPDWWCETEEVNKTIPLSNNDDDMYQVCSINGTTCPRIRYASDMKTIIEEFDLVCDRKQLASTIITFQLCGGLIVSLLTGQVADYIGRKMTLMILFLVHTVFCAVSVFSHNWELFAAMRLVIGGAICGASVVDTTLACEFTGHRWRSYIASLPSWPIGVSSFALVAYIFHNWKHISIAASVITLPFLFGMIFVPESIRWLMVHGRLDEVKQIVRRIARINRKSCPDMRKIDKLVQAVMSEDTDETYTFWDLLRTRQMAKRTVILTYIWFVVGFTYYGISFGVVTLSGNLYLNLFLIAILDIPSSFVGLFLCNKIGRRCTLFWTGLLSCLFSLGFILNVFIGSSETTVLTTGLALMAKALAHIAWQTIKLYTLEVNPTVVRALATSVGSVATRIGAMVSVQLIYLDQLNGSVMHLVIAVLSIISSGLIWLLPETRNRGIPDTIRNIEIDGQAQVQEKPTLLKADDEMEKQALDTRSPKHSVGVMA